MKRSCNLFCNLRILIELVCSDVVDWEDQLDIVLLGLLNEFSDLLGSRLIEKRVANLVIASASLTINLARTSILPRCFPGSS